MTAAHNDGASAYLDIARPLYPCTDVAAVYKEQCYLMQTSYILQHNGYDFAKTFQLCATADEGYVETCYRSAGRDASGSTNSDITQTVTNCHQTQDESAIYNCMLGADRDFVSYYHNDSQALKLCEALAAGS